MTGNFDDKRGKCDEVDEELQGAIDWAHSIQARYAEQLAGVIARNATGDGPDPSLRAEIMTLAEQAGLEPEVTHSDLARTDRVKLSEFDEPDTRWQSQSSIDRLSKVMAEAGMGTRGRQLLAWSFPSGEVNALCAANSWDDRYYHIFIDSDLVTFCNSIAKLFAECFTTGTFKDGEIDPSSPKIVANARSERVALRAADLFGATVLHGTARASKPWLPTAEALGLCMLIGRALKDFVVAHELGHLTLHHLEAEDTRVVSIAEFEDFDAIVYSHEAEFQADAVGAILTTQAAIAGSYSNLYTCIAPYIFLRSIETLDFCYEIFDRRSAGLSFTHPSATRRAEHVREVIGRHLAYHDSGKLLTAGLRRVDQISHWLRFAATQYLHMRKAVGAAPRPQSRLRAVERGDPPELYQLRSERNVKAPRAHIRDTVSGFDRPNKE